MSFQKIIPPQVTFLFIVFICSPGLIFNCTLAHSESEKKVHSLSLRDVAQLAWSQNLEIVISDLGRSIAQEKVNREWAIFEPQMKVSWVHNDRLVPTDAATAASLSSLLSFQNATQISQNDYAERSSSYKLSLETLLPTGGTISLGTTFLDLDNDQVEATYPDLSDPKEYSAVVSAELQQPLLRGAWTDVTLAGIRIAEKDMAIARQTYRKSMMQVISQAIERYWNVYYAQEYLRIQEKSVHLTQQILEESKQRVQAGKMAQSELLQIRSGILKRKARVSQAEQGLKEAENALRNLLSETSLSSSTALRVAGQPVSFDVSRELRTLLQNAYALRPEYKAAILEAEQMQTRMIVAENNRLPQLDLVASFQRNGLDVQEKEPYKQVLEDNYNSWSLGLELSIPLGGGWKSQSELAALKLQKKQILLKIKAAEIKIANSVETSLKNVSNSQDQWQLNTQNTKLMKELLDIELKKLPSGHTTSRDILIREADLNAARQERLKSSVQYQQALAQLALAQGSILEHFGLDLKEVEHDQATHG